MTCWSAENATKAYIKTMRMGLATTSADEPTGAEFISALAAGNNAQLMVVASSGAADSTTVALVIAAQQTGGRIVCILRGLDELNSSRLYLGTNAGSVDFVIGDAEKLVLNDYKESDFIAIDCLIENHAAIIAALQAGNRNRRYGTSGNCVVLGYNAFCNDSWRNSPLKTQLLPIVGGLLVSQPARQKKNKGNWIVKMDKCTGEEHVFRVSGELKNGACCPTATTPDTRNLFSKVKRSNLISDISNTIIAISQVGPWVHSNN